MLICLPLHAFAVQNSALGPQAVDISHALEHLHHVSHHHDANGVIHYDDSENSSEHAAETSGTTQLTAILPAGALHVAAASSLVDPPFGMLVLPDGIVTVPIRPPSAIG